MKKLILIVLGLFLFSCEVENVQPKIVDPSLPIEAWTASVEKPIIVILDNPNVCGEAIILYEGLGHYMDTIQVPNWDWVDLIVQVNENSYHDSVFVKWGKCGTGQGINTLVTRLK